METFEKEMNDMKEYYGSGETKKVSWRESQLKGLRRFLIEKEEDILKALMLDLGKHQVETFRDEIRTLMKSLNFALSNLKYWILGKKAKLPQIALLSSADIVPEHLGVVLLISSWNFPFGLSLELLIGVVAAGNTVVLKPSELSPACSSILALGLPNFLDNKAIKVVQGSARVGKIVMSAAAKHLTPVTLELGGKCPAVVDSLSSSWDLEVCQQYEFYNDKKPGKPIKFIVLLTTDEVVG
ncbi:hypothetical protein AAHE18_03G204600 [Arachis hypogaea]